MKVCILGAGMAGMLAAKACEDARVDYEVLSEAPQEERGVRYLHDPCGLPIKPSKVETLVIMPNKHIKRIDDLDLAIVGEWYGSKTCSSLRNNSLTRSVPVAEVYDWYHAKKLLHGIQVTPCHIRPEDMKYLSSVNNLLVSTVPLKSVFPGASGSCRTHTTYVSDGAPDDLPNVPRRYDGVIVYNIDPESRWHRYSSLMGVEQTEWTLPVPEAVAVRKVLGSTGYRPHLKNVLLTGRYGKWDSKVMAHDAYYDTLQAIDRILNGYEESNADE